MILWETLNVRLDDDADDTSMFPLFYVALKSSKQVSACEQMSLQIYAFHLVDDRLHCFFSSRVRILCPFYAHRNVIFFITNVYSSFA